jgi:hypothetical protein
MHAPNRFPLHRSRHGLIVVASVTLSLLIACSPDTPLATPAAGSATADEEAAIRPGGPLTISAAHMLAVPDGPCTYVQPTAINDAGVIVGSTFQCPDQKVVGVQWDAADNVTRLPEVDGLGLQPFHIDDRGTILATTYQRDTDRTRYFRLEPSGQIAEFALPDRPGSTFLIVAGPNRRGTMLLTELPFTGAQRFHLWDGRARTTRIPQPPNGELRLNDLNDRDAVVGHIRTGVTAMQPVTWSRQHGFRTLDLPPGAEGGAGALIDDVGRVFGGASWPLPASCTGFFGTASGRVTLWNRAGVPQQAGDGQDFLCSSGPDLRDVNRGGVAVGSLQYRVDYSFAGKAFVVTADGRTAIAPCEIAGVAASEGCNGVAINRGGVVVGLYISPPLGIRGVTWTVSGG